MAAPLQVRIFEADSRRMPELADASVDLEISILREKFLTWAREAQRHGWL